MSATRIELLQRMPIFGALRADSLQFLVEQARVLSVAADAFFFREGDQASSMFVLEAGRVAVLKGWQGRELLVRHLAKGDCFGEMALMDLFPRSASVRAVENCTAIELTPAHLFQLFERDAEQFALIQMNIGREICRRLRESDDALFRARMGDSAVPTDHVFRST
ncbi:MAG TPA: cyclic nucleotide-binding domain-containing protein [Burkholderiaceae bacterium]|nr:cyclic nucleotide-binding domain-containing protein [Burkholderiaceae bacterium]